MAVSPLAPYNQQTPTVAQVSQWLKKKIVPTLVSSVPTQPVQSKTIPQASFSPVPQVQPTVTPQQVAQWLSSNFTPQKQAVNPSYINTLQPEKMDVLKSLWANIMQGDSKEIIRSKYPEISQIDDNVLWQLGANIMQGDDMDTIIQKFPELSKIVPAVKQPSLLDQAKSNIVTWFPTRAVSSWLWAIWSAVKWAYEWLAWQGLDEALQRGKEVYNDPNKSFGEKLLEIPVWVIAAKYVWCNRQEI